MADVLPVVLLAGAAEPAGEHLARAVLLAGGKVAAAVPRAWQVAKLREQLDRDSVATHRLLIGVVAARDAEAAAGFVKGAKDALGEITHFVGTARLLRDCVAGREPAGDLDELLEANLHSNVTLARAVLPAMRRGKCGRLLFATAPDDLGKLSVTCRASLSAIAEYADALASDVVSAGLRVGTIPIANEPASEGSSPPASHPWLAPWLAALLTTSATA